MSINKNPILKINYRLQNKDIETILPDHKTDGSAGLDLCSSSKEVIHISPGAVSIIPTNIILEIPSGYEGQVRSRSGLALKHSVAVLNSPGTIDPDYRGEIKVLLINHGTGSFAVNFGDRIAQLVISCYEKVELVESVKLTDTERGEGGYGSTGVNQSEK
ncbi:dUTP diphosphatase [soil metagenome]